MEKIRSSSHFWKSFLHPRVIFFIIAGTGIIFLTFLTDDNALEIVISGVASVFIGIGVNNFSNYETRLRDEKRLRSKISHAVKVMQITKSRIKTLHHELNNNNFRKVKDELAELEQVIDLSMELIREEETLD